MTSAAEFDLDIYVTCKPFLAAKDRKIARVCVEELSAIANSTEAPFRILDVGTGEASLLRRVCARLLPSLRAKPDSDSPHVVQVDCVEPSPAGQEYVDGLGRRFCEAGLELTHRPTRIEDYLDLAGPRYDAILAFHSLYHIPRRAWLRVLRRLVARLTDEGVLLLSLVSRTSDIYGLLDTLSPVIKRQRPPRTFESQGWLYFAEDLIPVLDAIGEDVRVREIEATIRFPAREVAEARRGLANRSGQSSQLIRFLAFMLRLQPQDLVTAGSGALESLLADKSTLAFRSVDRFCVVTGRSA